METNRAKKGDRQFRSSEISDALEFYYAFYGQLPAGYQCAELGWGGSGERGPQDRERVDGRINGFLAI